MMYLEALIPSLPALEFGAPAPMSWSEFTSRAGTGRDASPRWLDLDAQLRNAIAAARGGEKWQRPVEGCSIYWRRRVEECFQEKDVAKRDELLDRTRWDAAGELTDPAAPLGMGALETYAVRLRIALRRDRISREGGEAAFAAMTKAARRE